MKKKTLPLFTTTALFLAAAFCLLSGGGPRAARAFSQSFFGFLQIINQQCRARYNQHNNDDFSDEPFVKKFTACYSGKQACNHKRA